MTTKGIIIGAIILGAAALVFNNFHAGKKPKHTPPNSKEAALNECSVQAYNKYLQLQTALTNAEGSDPLSSLSIQRVLATRRVQEQFCLELTHCNSENLENKSASLAEAAMFDSCLRNETLEQYDAASGQDD